MTELSSENAELATIVRHLHETVQPDQPPDAAFRARLRNRLQDEWNRSMRPLEIQRIKRQRFMRRAALAAVVAAVVGVTVLILDSLGGADGEVEGTARGPSTEALGFLAILAVVGVLVFAVAYFRNRNT